MPSSMSYWHEPMLNLLENTQAVPGKEKNPAQADQQGSKISKPDFRVDFGFEDFDESHGVKHDGNFEKSLAAGKVTDGMKKAGY